MPDRMNNNWTALVRDRLRPLDLPAQEIQQVVAELAVHLEDIYEDQIQLGRSQSEARERAMQEVARWRLLARNIQRAKLKEEIMNPRTKQLWLPGLISLASAMALLMILIRISMQPLFLGRSPLQMVLLPWLVMLPLCGAAGAYLSRRGGAYRLTRLAAGLFPTIVLFFLGSILTATHLIVPAQPRLWYGSLAVALGIILPSAALLLGALPFLSGSGKTESPCH